MHHYQFAILGGAADLTNNDENAKFAGNRSSVLLNGITL